MQPLEDVASDNTAGAHPAVLAAVVAANEGRTTSYGDDPWTAHAMQLVLRPHEAVICAHTAHIETDECGATERYLGCKLLPMVTPDGKLTPALIASRVRDIGDPHPVQVRAVSISQPTELGTLFTREELRALAATSRAHGLALHVDGARLPMAAAALECSLAQATGAPDVDVVSFGGTKCGALAAESVVGYRAGLADALAYQRKQAMQLASKLRFVGAQYLEVAQPIETNAVFARLPAAARDELSTRYSFGLWEGELARFMTAWDSTPAHVDAFVAHVRAAVAHA